MTEADPTIRINDIRATGHCVRGAGRWFTANGLDYKRFLREGMPASELLATGDALAKQVVDAKLERDAENG